MKHQPIVRRESKVLIEVLLPEEHERHLNEPAKAELRSAIGNFAEDLLEEAGRLEAAMRTTKGDPEVTSSMVRDADLLVRRGYRKVRKPRWLVLAQIVVIASTFTTGVLLDFQKFQTTPLYLGAFIVSLAVALGTNIVVYLKE